MIIKAYYAGGRIDVFDTDRTTDGIPQPGNLLTNYALELSDVNEESLWLRSYYYEASQAYKDEPGPKGLPVARRRDGWSFLIADAEDMQRLNRLTVDGETVLIQVAGELVDVAALSWAYTIAEDIAPKAGIAYLFLERASRDTLSSMRDTFSQIGMPSAAFSILQRASAESIPGAAGQDRFSPQEGRMPLDFA